MRCRTRGTISVAPPSERTQGTLPFCGPSGSRYSALGVLVAPIPRPSTGAGSCDAAAGVTRSRFMRCRTRGTISVAPPSERTQGTLPFCGPSGSRYSALGVLVAPIPRPRQTRGIGPKALVATSVSVPEKCTR